MALSKEEILDAIASMSVLEVSELIKMMEEKFGVSAAARTALPPVPAPALHNDHRCAAQPHAAGLQDLHPESE